MLTGLLYYPVNTADSHRSSSLGTLQSVPGGEEGWEAAVLTGFSCTAYILLSRDKGGLLMYLRVFIITGQDWQDLNPGRKLTSETSFSFCSSLPWKKIIVTWEIVQQQSLGWRLFQSNFQSFTTSWAAINFDEFQCFGTPFSCLYFADYRSSGISFTKPFTKGS